MTHEPTLSGVVVLADRDEKVGEAIGRLESAVPEGLRVQTFDQLVDDGVRAAINGMNQLVCALVAFSLVALFAARIVISNAFTIIVAQRTRELALMRCLGADGTQVRRMVLLEAAILGIGASVAGVAVMYLLIESVLRMASGGGSTLMMPSHVDLSITAVVVPICLGVAVTVGTAIFPVRLATSVMPLHALRRVDTPEETTRAGLVRALTSALVVVVGVGLMGLAVALSRSAGLVAFAVLVGMVGGAVSFFGVLLGAAFFVPPAVAILGGQSRQSQAFPPALPR